MPFALNRRQVLFSGASLALGTIRLCAQSQAEYGPARYGPAQPFDYDWLRRRAKSLAAASFAAEPPPAPSIVSTIDFDAVQKIKFRAERAICAQSPFPVRMNSHRG